MYVQSFTSSGNWSHSSWQTSKRKAFPAGSQEHMIIQLTAVSLMSRLPRLLKPRSSDLQHTHVCVRAAHRKPSHSFWERRQHVLICATPAKVCVCAGKSPILPNQPKFSDLHAHSCVLANSISAQNTIISLQLISLVLGARPRRPDPSKILQHTYMCVCTDQPTSSGN